MDFDTLRAAYPDLAVSLYALEPGGPVTLEIIPPGESAYTFTAPTALEAIERAFPPDVAPEPPAPVSNAFD